MAAKRPFWKMWNARRLAMIVLCWPPLCLAGALPNAPAKGERVGVFLPNTNGMGVTLFALQAYGRVPAHLNYSTGLKNLRSACCTAKLNTVLTSRRFIEVGELEPMIEGIKDIVNIVYLEDIKAEIGTLAKLSGVSKKLAPRFSYKRMSGAPIPDMIRR